MTATTAKRNGAPARNGRANGHANGIVELPSDILAERLLLGEVLVNPESAEIAADVLIDGAAEFFGDYNGRIFSAVLHCLKAGDADAMQVRAELQRRGELDVELDPYLADLLCQRPSAPSAQRLAETVHGLHCRRMLVAHAHRLAAAAQAGDNVAVDVAALSRFAGPVRGKLPPIQGVAELLHSEPRLHDPIVHGLFRRGEVVNLISGSKSGKTWLGLNLMMSLAAGLDTWLGFRIERSRVLYVDCELHRATLAHRIGTVAAALGLEAVDVADRFRVLSLRGQRPTDIYALTQDLRGDFDVILLDPLYRLMPAGFCENDNAQVAGVYSALDRAAQRLQAAFVCIHHASKGVQGDKRVTDVGAGAGAQSRAADSHLVLREHEDPNVAVLDTAARSWPPIEPVALRWECPLWRLDPTADATRIKTRRPTKRDDGPPDVQSVELFIDRVFTGTPATKEQLREAAMKTRRYTYRASLQLINEAIATGRVTAVPRCINGKTAYKR